MLQYIAYTSSYLFKFVSCFLSEMVDSFGVTRKLDTSVIKYP